ncbi:MAG: bifunctional adenosylcobinamide kinase/adenosylcobinamide-phosphate guanylyltransferase [Nanoarchaeota archaeon]|nr:bifunctional adenosylcobinamide kinase/adenosylcobinamide-phosphate guanylyltransferase [Nanoarchaeota archaeon]
MTSCDELLEENKEVTLIYGPSASGKTTLAIQTAIKQAEKGKKVLYMDTEGGFSTERVKQINSNPKILDNILLLRVKEFMEQRVNFRKMKELVEKGKISLVIIDTIGMHYRLYLQKNSYGANLCLQKQFRILNEIAKELKIPVIVTNQVYNKIESFGVRPVGGDIVFNNCQKWIELRKEPRRELIVKKPQPEKHIDVMITGKGLERAI